MSCNGCRILRKGCNDNCILRQSIQSIDSPQSQANATLFVAKFFGRAGLISFLSSVAESQRPALFQSLLYEACGRTVNPVSGAVGLMATGNWHACESAVETVLRGGVLRPSPVLGEGLEAKNNGLYGSRDLNSKFKRKEIDIDDEIGGLDLGLTAGVTAGRKVRRRSEKRRPATPSDDVSETTTLESGFECDLQQNFNENERNLLRLFF